jgi:hypothetical protein
VNADFAALAEWAATWRPDWDRAAIDGALQAAQFAGWPPGRIAREVAALVADEDSSPWAITDATRDPRHRAKAIAAQATRDGAAMARAALEAAIASGPPEPAAPADRHTGIPW